MRKRTRDDVEDQMKLLINNFRLSRGELPPRVSVTESDYLLLCRRDPLTREVVKPKVFHSVPIVVV
jgi:hypothetical protein